MALTPLNFVNLRNGHFDATTRDDLRRAIQAFEASGQTTLALHLHGGLVSEKAAMAMAERLLPEYKAAAYPMFFVWESGLVEAIRNNLGEIAKEQIFKRLLTKLAQYALGKLQQPGGGRGALVPATESAVAAELSKLPGQAEPFASLSAVAGAGEVTQAELQQFQNDLEADLLFQNAASALAVTAAPAVMIARGATVTPATTMMDARVLEDIRQDVQPNARGLISSARIVKGAVVILARVIRRFAQGRGHGVHATIVEEILREFYLGAAGRFIWDLIKQDTADAFAGGTEVAGGTAFLQEVAGLLAKGRPVRLVLIGHSAGSVYICNLLRAMQDLPQDFQVDVIFMAPACTFGAFAAALARHGSRIRQLRMFSMADATERLDILVPVLYPHSLLYFISGVLEAQADEPILGMQRFLTGTAAFYSTAESNIPAVKRYLEALEQHRLAWSPSPQGAPAGLQSDAITHGGFDDTTGAPRQTIDSVKQILQHGF